MESPAALNRYRLLLLIAGFLYPVWSLVETYRVLFAYDPFWQRSIISALMVTVFGLSYTSALVRKHIELGFAVCIHLLTLHFIFVVYMNDLELIYTARAFLIVIFAVATFTSRRLLASYGLFAVVCSTLIAVLSSPNQNERLLPVGITVIVLVGWVFLNNTLRLIAKLAEREQNFRQLIDSTFESICIHDNGVIVDVNETMARLFAYAPQEMVGRKLADFVEGEIGTKRDGTKLTLELNSKPYTYRRRNLTFVAMRDTTERKNMESQLRIADRMASIGTLAAGVGHEINNPLFLVSGNLQLLTESLEKLAPAHPELRETLGYAERARKGADRVRIIVRDLKILTRQDENTLGPVDAEKVLDSSIAIANNQIRHRARLVREYREVPAVFGNEARLGQVFVNLLINAAQAIDEMSSSRNEIRVRLHPGADDRVIIEVSDTGKGMTREVQERIFDPFFTTKEIGAGTGLGLTICHRIVVSLGGAISVDSTEGKGTTFRVSLPAAALVAARPHLRLVENRGPSRFRILVVDDEPLVTSLLASYLSAHDVEVASNGREALEKISGGAGFDVILSDLMMPEMSGMELYQQLDPATRERVVFMTGGAFTPLSREVLASVVNPIVEKPFDLAELKRVLFAVAERADAA